MKQIEDVKEIQRILFEILKFFRQVCQKNELTFYLSNGTLLGAVKYKEFIPWDDDVDIFMPRADYDKLMNLEDVDNGLYELLAKERNQLWNMPYAKLRDKRTILKETSANFGMENGIAIDIFPLDNWCGNKKKAILQAKYCGLLRRFLTASIEEKFTSAKKGVQRCILYLIWKYSRLRGTQVFYNKIIGEVCKGRKNTEYKGCIAWSLYGEKEVISSAVFSESVDVMFCGEVFPAPIGYDMYLNNLYGDYFKDPPKEKQKSHHDIMVWWKDEY